LGFAGGADFGLTGLAGFGFLGGGVVVVGFDRSGGNGGGVGFEAAVSPMASASAAKTGMNSRFMRFPTFHFY